MTGPGLFFRPTDDPHHRSIHGSAELALRPTDADRLSLAVHYRRDRHDEFQQSFPSGFTEPRQRSVEDTYSIAGEYARDLTPTVALTLGASYDWRDLSRAEEYGTPPTGGAARIFSYPLRNADAWNAQGRIEWKPVESSRLYASVSSRARFPTLFERFSTQFGTAASNPGLNAERATNYELGGSHAIGALTVTAACSTATSTMRLWRCVRRVSRPTRPSAGTLVRRTIMAAGSSRPAR